MNINRKVGLDCPIIDHIIIGNIHCEDCSLYISQIEENVTCINVKKVTKYEYNGFEYNSIEELQLATIREVIEKNYHGNVIDFLDNNKELVDKYYKLTE